MQVTELRLLIGWGMGALWLAWFTLAGRSRKGEALHGAEAEAALAEVNARAEDRR